jgi:hypothetical protein
MNTPLYQKSNYKPQIDEGQTMQWPKEKYSKKTMLHKALHTVPDLPIGSIG